MTPITPKVSQFLLPENGVTEVKYSEHQEEYITLPALRTSDGRVVSQWQPDANELILLNNGVAVTLVQHTFFGPLQPIQLVVGGMDLR